MPNRVIRDGFLYSRAIETLDAWSEIVYHRLLLVVDDAGRYEYEPDMLTSALFPIRQNVDAAAVERSIEQCAAAHLVILYGFGGRRYLQVTKWVRTGRTLQSRHPWKDGTYTIEFVTLPFRGGPKPVVKTSIISANGASQNIPSVSHSAAQNMGYAGPISHNVTQKMGCLSHADGIGIPSASHRHPIGIPFSEQENGVSPPLILPPYTGTNTETKGSLSSQPMEPTEEARLVWSLWPDVDDNNAARMVSKTQEDLLTARLVVESGYPLLRSVRAYLWHCKRRGEWVKDLGTWLQAPPPLEAVVELERRRETGAARNRVSSIPAEERVTADEIRKLRRGVTGRAAGVAG